MGSDDGIIKSANVCGIDVSINLKCLNNWDLIEAIGDMDECRDDPDPFAMRRLAVLLFGKDQWKSILDSLRELGDGVIEIPVMYKFLYDALAALNNDSESLKN